MIKDLLKKHETSSRDTTLARNLLIEARVVSVPEKILGGYVILEDESATLEAATIKKSILEQLKLFECTGKNYKFKGRLDKTEYGNIAFEIEEILES